MNVLSPEFWASGFWQGIGALVSIISLFVSPLISIFFERLLGKKDQQDYIGAYKALALPDSALGPGEALFFLPIQIIASYGISILMQRVILVRQDASNTMLIVSGAFVFLVTWGLCSARRKSLAKLLTWHFCFSAVLFCLILIGVTWQKGGNAYITGNFTFVQHWVEQYLSPDIRQFPPVASLLHLPLTHIPVDLKIASPVVARNLFTQVYFFTLASMLVFYTLHKRHRANRITAFVHLNEKQRKDEFEKTDYQDKLASLELKSLAKKEKEDELDLKKELRAFIIEKERLLVESTRLDVEKKRAEYTLELAVNLIDTIYGKGGNPDERMDTIRITLPAFKDFGQPEINSTAVVLQVLRDTQPQPQAIPVSIVP